MASTSSGVDTAPVFEDVLDRGEKIIWAGRPKQDTPMPLDLRSTLLMGCTAIFCLLFALLAALLAPALLYKVIGVAAGLIFCIFSVSALLSPAGGGLLARQKTYYALTDRRALAIYQGRVPSLITKKYGDPKGVRLKLSKNGAGTISFGEGTMTYLGVQGVRGGTRPQELRFVDVEDAARVYGIVCERSPE